jgi:hypothetical protein
MKTHTSFEQLILRAVLHKVSPMVTRVLALPGYLDLESFDEVLRILLHQSSAVAPHQTGSVIAASYSAVLPHRGCLLAPRCASILVRTVYKRQPTVFQPVSAVGGKPLNRRCATRTQTPEKRGSRMSGSALLSTWTYNGLPAHLATRISLFSKSQDCGQVVARPSTRPPWAGSDSGKEGRYRSKSGKAPTRRSFRVRRRLFRCRAARYSGIAARHSGSASSNFSALLNSRQR